MQMERTQKDAPLICGVIMGESMREITIRKCLNGYVISVGCKTLVFGKKKKLLKELSRYIDDPKSVEKEYLEKFDSHPSGTEGGVLIGRVGENFGCFIPKLEVTKGVHPINHPDENEEDE